MFLMKKDNETLINFEEECIFLGYEELEDSLNVRVNITESYEPLREYDVYFDCKEFKFLSISDYQRLETENRVIHIYKLINGEYLIGEELERIDMNYIEHSYTEISTYDWLLEYVKKHYNRKTAKLLEIS